MYAVSTRNNRNRITLLLCDGKSEEDDEGSHCQSWEEHANGDEELEAFEPGAPVVLQVHDVCDERPERQNPCQRQDFISNVHAKRNCTGLVEYHDKAETLVNECVMGGTGVPLVASAPLHQGECHIHK